MTACIEGCDMKKIRSRVDNFHVAMESSGDQFVISLSTSVTFGNLLFTSSETFGN